MKYLTSSLKISKAMWQWKISELLANLQGLKVLQIGHLDWDRNVYRNHRYEPFDGTRNYILQAMCLIQQTEVFEFKCPWSAEEIKKEFGETSMPFNLEWLTNTLGLRTECPTKIYFVHNRWEWPWIDLDLSICQIPTSCNGLSKFDAKLLIRVLIWMTDSKIGSCKLCWMRG